MILVLDPSSTRTGYAVFRDAPYYIYWFKGVSVVEAGYLRPERVRDDIEQRIDEMAIGLETLIRGWQPELVIIEVPSGIKGRALQRGNPVAFARYVLAVGELRRVAKMVMRELHRPKRDVRLVISVDERVWTRGESKLKRQRRMAMLFPKYAEQMARDSGADVADAIGIGVWWLETEMQLVNRPPARR